jgi:hypothetical protein
MADDKDRIGRDAKTGRFISVDDAKKRPDKTVTEPRGGKKPGGKKSKGK